MKHLEVQKVELPGQCTGKNLLQTPREVCKTLRDALGFAPGLLPARKALRMQAGLGVHCCWCKDNA